MDIFYLFLTYLEICDDSVRFLFFSKAVYCLGFWLKGEVGCMSGSQSLSQACLGS